MAASSAAECRADGKATAGPGKSVGFALFASSALLVVYFGALTLVSGWSFATSQFAQFWFYVLPLALGFGVQVGLYVHLKQLAMNHHAGHVVAASGTTSGAAMISCCAHYLANVLPIIGAAGIVTVIAQYQVELFWLGLAFNAAGIVYVAHKVLVARAAFAGSHS